MAFKNYQFNGYTRKDNSFVGVVFDGENYGEEPKCEVKRFVVLTTAFGKITHEIIDLEERNDIDCITNYEEECEIKLTSGLTQTLYYTCINQETFDTLEEAQKYILG